MYKTKSLSVNVIVNLLNQMSAAVFPLITFPHVSRVLRPEGLGRVSFAEAVASYFIMLATLGIPLYGVRESARCRDDKKALSTLVIELFALNTIMTTLATAAFVAFMVFSDKACADPALFWICVLPMFLRPLGFNWLLGGLEEYIYIAKRTLCMRALVAVAVFLFIRTTADLHIYALIAALNTAGANLMNVIFVRTRISLRDADWQRLNVWRHLKPILLIFSLNGLVNIYTSLNRVMLGYMTNDAEVGFYAAADRVVTVVVVLVTSMGVVLLPRASYYVKCEKVGEYQRLTTTALRLILLVSFPVAAGLIALAHPFMLLLSGSGFGPAIPLVQILGVTVVWKALSHFLGYQVLYPQGKAILLIYSSLCGALFSLVLNWLLIPRWHATGAALSTLMAEMCITGMQIILSRTYAHFTWPIRGLLRYGVTAVLMAMVVLSLNSFLTGTTVPLLLSVGAGAAFYVTALWLLRDSMLSTIWNRLTASAAL